MFHFYSRIASTVFESFDFSVNMFHFVGILPFPLAIFLFNPLIIRGLTFVFFE